MIQELVQQWLPYIIALGPAIAALIGVITGICKLFKFFKELKEDLKNDSDFKAIKKQIQVVIQENYELKAQIKTLINKIDKIQE